VTWFQHLSANEHQQSVNDFVCCILYNPRAVLRHLSKIEVIAAFIGHMVFVDTVTPQNERQHSISGASTENQHSVNRVSTECQFCGVLHHVYSEGSAPAYVHNQGIASHSVQMRS
jgi:hypothetical protein